MNSVISKKAKRAKLEKLMENEKKTIFQNFITFSLINI
jgi:hypothetical protein